MQQIYRACLVLIIILQTALIRAQEYVLKFQNITTNQGLSDNRITDVLQDSEGFLWAINNLAVNKFNGKDTEIYDIVPNGVPNQLMEDSSGRIWVATTKGLFIYQATDNQFVQLKSEVKDYNNILLHNIIKLIETKEKGTYWIISNSSLARFQIKENDIIDDASFKIIEHQSPYDWTTIVEGENGTLWLGNSAGNLYTCAQDTLNQKDFLMNKGRYGINDIAIDRSQQVWIGTHGNGLFRWNTTTSELKHFKKGNGASINNNIILSLLADPADNIWIGTDGGGLNLYQQDNASFHFFQQSYNKEYSISDNSILSVKTGLDNTILVATVHGGISIFNNHLDIKRISPQKLQFHYKDEQSSSILEDSDQNIWLSAGREGLRKYDPVNHTVEVFIDNPNLQSDLEGSIILSLFEDRLGRIWIGTLRGGLNIYDRNKKRFITAIPGRQSRRIYAIAETSDGHIWVGSSEGIQVYDLNINLVDTIEISSQHNLSNNVKALYRDVKGSMWVGTEMGMHCYTLSPMGMQKQSFYANPQDSTALMSNHVISIAEAADLTVLIGTYGKGVDSYSRTSNSFQPLPTKNKLDGTLIRGILKDHADNMWFSTNMGLSKMDLEGNVVNLTPNEGVQAFKGGAATLSKNGALLMAGSEGLTYFHPNQLLLNASKPRVFFTSASVLNNDKTSDSQKQIIQLDKPVVDTPIILKSNTLSFTVNFSSSNLFAPEEVKYAYMLEGLNTTWQMIENNRNLTFSSLKPGQYILKIKAANLYDEWSDHVATLKVEVIPSFWQRKTTKLIFVLTVIALLVLFYKWRIAAVKAQKKNLQRLLKIQTEEVKKQQDEVYQGRIAVLKAEKMNQKLNQKKLKDELKFKIDELTNHTLRTVHKNNLLSDIKEKLNKEIATSKSDKHNLKNIVSLINDSFILDKDWKSFYSIFNQVHPTFIKDLKNHKAKLSERDIQLCALIKLEFSSQHIATLFGISLSSVKVARHRLRKKLNIGENHTLKEFLKDFSSTDLPTLE